MEKSWHKKEKEQKTSGTKELLGHRILQKITDGSLSTVDLWLGRGPEKSRPLIQNLGSLHSIVLRRVW